MQHELALAFARVTEGAALAGHKWLGCGDKNIADGAAVEAMRLLLNQTAITGEIVIGEGEIDEAPMLYIGEKVGLGGEGVDIAVDPIEGTRMTAMGQGNAIAVLAAGEAGSFLKAPDMYMEKLVVGPQVKGHIDISLPLTENLANIANALNKNINELVMITLAKPRHDALIKQMHDLGVRVYAVPDGDVAASILTCMPESDVDFMYCIGGAPEGVISAAAIRALGGDMQACLLPRHEVKGDTPENQKLGAKETQRCHEMGIAPNTPLRLDDMAKSDKVFFAGTGITKGDLVDGVARKGNLATTETLLISGQDQTIRRIQTTYNLDRQSAELQTLIR